MNEYSVKNATLFVFFLGIFVVVFAVMSFDGYFFYDDNDYINYAHQITTGKFQIGDNIFAHRLGIILPLATSYEVFGFSDVATVALPLICTLACLWALWRFFVPKNNSENIEKNTNWGIWTCIFFSLDFYTLFFANKIYPDVLLTLFTLGAVLVLFKRNNHAAVVCVPTNNIISPPAVVCVPTNNIILSSILFVLFNFLALISKELIVYVLPFYMYVFAQDMQQKENNTHSVIFWKWSILLGIFVLGAYFGAYYYHTGDFFYRFRSIEDGRYEAVSSYFDKPISVLLARLTYEPIIMFVSGTTMIVFAGALPSFWRVFRNVFTKTTSANHIETYFTWLCVSILVCFWFGSTSLQVYNPIGLFPRMILFVVPFLAVLAGLNFHKIITNQKYQYFFSVIFLFSGIIAWQTVGLKTAFIYFLLTFWISFYEIIYQIIHKTHRLLPSPRSTWGYDGSTPLGLFCKEKIVLKTLKGFNNHNPTWNVGNGNNLFFMIGFVVIMLIHPVFSMLKPTETGYKAQKNFLQNYFSEGKKLNPNPKNEQIIIFSDHTTQNGENIYFDFKKPTNITFKHYNDTISIKNSSKYYLLVNDFSVEKPQNIPTNWKLLVEKNNIKLYEKSNNTKQKSYE